MPHRKFLRHASHLALTLFAFALLPALAQPTPAHNDSPAGSWHFIVSGDSRNCGDIVMPTIAANSAQFKPEFYWHLGDLRAIYKIDEDMAHAAAASGETLKCSNYRRLAWNDFVTRQIAPFGETPFYVGIGNHEIMPPKSEDAFQRQFYDWLNQRALRHQRALDGEPAQPEPWFHWIQGGVDFIYLDNSSGYFSEDELTWFFHRLANDKYDPTVKTLVVGMHEALPGSIANKHSMGDSDDLRGPQSGEMVYRALVNFRENYKRNVLVLASHSHFYMANIFASKPTTAPGNPPKLVAPLDGWIVGTAGAVRYELPDGVSPSPAAQPHVYGYLLATVTDGNVSFEFKEVDEASVPKPVAARYPDGFVSWCFQHNLNKEKDPDPSCPND